jgi:hypothetical protein
VLVHDVTLNSAAEVLSAHCVVVCVVVYHSLVPPVVPVDVVCVCCHDQ